MVQRFNHKGFVRYKTEKQVKTGLLYSKFMTLWWESSDRFIRNIMNTYVYMYVLYMKSVAVK